MMKLDIQGLVRGICGLPEQEEGEGALFGEGYLVQCVALPFLCGEEISLHGIDWDAFDPEDARAAARFWRGAPFYAPTPLRRLDRTAAELGLGAAYLKDEGLRAPLGAFKLLGAGYAMARVLCGDGDLSWEKAAESGKKAVFYTATDGNHGRAVAYMARAFGCRAVVLMPAGASRERFETIAAEGAEVTVEDANYDECVRRARALADENGGVLLQDTTLDNYEALPHEIMRGYAAIAAEVFEDLPEPPRGPWPRPSRSSGRGRTYASSSARPRPRPASCSPPRRASGA